MPQFYLRRFADYDDRLRVLNKETCDVFGPVHIRNVAVESNYHTIKTDEGPSDEFEQIVSALEEMYAEGFRLLDAQFPPTAEARAYTAMFVAFQFVRSSTWRDITLTTQGDMMKWAGQMAARRGMHDDRTRAWFRTVWPDMTDEELDEQLRWGAEGEYTVNVDPQEHVRLMLNHLQDDRLPNIVRDRSWSLVYSRYPHEFIISEHPVALWSADQGPQGLGTAEELTLPLDRNRMLVMTWDANHEGKRRLATPQMTAHLNARTRDAARRFVYAHPLTPLASLTGTREGSASGRRPR